MGFIQKLPTTLVAAFQATLEEISEADLLLHVIDISHADAAAQARSVIGTLRDIGADTLPLLTAANKIDVLPNGKPAFPEAVPISALTGEGMPELLAAIENELYIVMVPVRVQLPYEQGRLISMFHEHGLVELEQHVDGVVKMEGRLPRRLTWAFKPYREDLEESALG